MLIYAAFVWRMTGDPLAWAEGHAAWGRTYQGLSTLVEQPLRVPRERGARGVHVDAALRPDERARCDLRARHHVAGLSAARAGVCGVHPDEYPAAAGGGRPDVGWTILGGPVSGVRLARLGCSARATAPDGSSRSWPFRRSTPRCSSPGVRSTRSPAARGASSASNQREPRRRIRRPGAPGTPKPSAIIRVAMMCRERPACLRSECPPSRASYSSGWPSPRSRSPPLRCRWPRSRRRRAARIAVAPERPPRLHRRAVRRSRSAHRQARRPRSGRRRAEGARGHRARPLCAGRGDAAARSCESAGERSRAAARPAPADARSPRCRLDAREGRRRRRRCDRGQGAGAGGARAAGARPLPGSQRGLSRRGGRRRPAIPAINTGWGELFLEKYNSVEAVRSFQAALQADPRWEPALVGFAEAMADDNPPQAMEIATRALEINPSDVAAQHLHRQPGRSTRAITRRRGSRSQRALAVNPSSLEAHAWLAAIAYVEDKDADYEAEVGKALRRLAVLRRRLPHRRRGGRAQLPLRRRGGADAAGARARSRRTRGRSRIWASTCCARATSPGARSALGRVVQARPVQRRHVQPARDAGHARHVHDGARRRPRPAHAEGRGAGAAGVRARARAQGAHDARRALRVHAARADPHRDLRQARRFRRAQRRPAGDDRRARRLLRPRGDDGFAEGAAAGDRSTGRRRSGTSWRTSSRCRCRTSACRAG